MAGYLFARQDVSKLTDAEIDQLLAETGRLYAARKDVPGEAADIQTYLANLSNERERRGIQKEQEKTKGEIQALFGQAEAQDTASAERARQYIQDIFKTGKASGETSINEAFIPQRQQAIEEAGAMGLMRQPGLLSSILANVDTRKSNALRDLYTSLEGQKAQSGLGLEDTLFNRGTQNKQLALQKAGLLSGINQFGQTFGLQKDQFGEQKRQNQMSDLFNQITLDQAKRAGEMEAESKKPGTLDYLNTAFGGLSSLGKLAGGAGTAYTAFKGK